MRLAFLAALVAASFSFGQTVEMPKAVEVAPGRLATVSIKYDGDDVRWICGKSLDIFREFDPDPKVIKLRVIGYDAGKFNLVAIAAKGGKLSEFSVCEITVTGTPPTPPNPGPTPGPTPAPESELAKQLRAAMVEDAGTKADLKKLGEGFQTASSAAAAIGSGKAGDMFRLIKQAINDSGVEGMPKTRGVCRNFLNAQGLATLPTDIEANLTPEQVKLIAKILLQIALALLEASK